MVAKREKAYKTQLARWLLTIALAITVFAVSGVVAFSSFQPQKTQTEASWQEVAKRCPAVSYYSHPPAAAVHAPNKYADRAIQINLRYACNQLTRVKFQYQQKLYASLKTILYYSSTGNIPQNSEQEAPLG